MTVDSLIAHLQELSQSGKGESPVLLIERDGSVYEVYDAEHMEYQRHDNAIFLFSEVSIYS